MKFVQKIISALVRPPKRRGFSRFDLIVLLLLGVVVITNLLTYALQPATVAHATRVVSVEAPYTKSQVDALAIPDAPPPSGQPTCTAQELQRLTGCTPQPPSQPPAQSPPSQQASSMGSPFSGGANGIFALTNPTYTVGTVDKPAPIVDGLWAVMIEIMDAFVILILILNGVKVMLGGSVFRYANAIEVFPGILLALIVANLSLPIMEYALQLNNGLSQTLYVQTNSIPITQAEYGGSAIVTKTCGSLGTLSDLAMAGLGDVAGASAAINNIVGNGLNCGLFGTTILNQVHTTDWNQTLQNPPSPPNITGGASITGFLFLFKSISDLLEFITDILVLMLIAQIVIRLFFIDFYAIMAPLGIGAWALPGRSGQALTRLWIHGFFSTLFVQFLQVVAFIIMHILVGAITSGVYAALYTSATNNDATLLWVIQIAQYWFLLRIPTLLSNGPMSPMNQLVGFGQTVGQVTQTAATIVASEIQVASSLAMTAGNLVIGAGMLR